MQSIAGCSIELIIIKEYRFINIKIIRKILIKILTSKSLTLKL